MFQKKQSGFTLVELLIVIVVIAILATISVVAYSGVQERAYNAAVVADLDAASRKLELARVDLGHYPLSYSDFPDFDINKSAYDTTRNNLYYIASRVNDTYALGVVSKAGKGFILTSDGLRQDVTGVSAERTASEISTTWTDGTNNYRFYAFVHDGGPPGVWSSSWSWVNN